MRANLKTLILALTCWIGLSAHAFIEDGIQYQILSYSDRTLEVVPNEDREYKGDLVIPQKIIYKNTTYTVISIGKRAFCGCSGLTSVSIPNSVTSINDYAFCDCSGLTSVSIPDSVTSIGIWAFCGCSGLTSMSIPNSVTSIGSSAFNACNNLTAIIVSENNNNYADIEGVLFDKNLSRLIRYPEGSKKTEYSIPNSVSTINDYAFYDCWGLTSVSIPNSVTSINDYAFCCCLGLTSVSIPNSVTSINDYAFCDCSGLTSVSIPDSVTSIGIWAFCGCSGLTSVSIPNSVTSIGIWAFFGCLGLTSVYIEKETALECNFLFSDVTFKECVLYIPKGSRASYESTDPWRKFWNIEEMEFSGVEEISEDSEEIKISVKDGTIIVDGIDKDAFIEVYSLNGACVYRGPATQIIGLTSGMYLVRVGDNSQKVIITD